jgi:metal-responsive CopG/Arc/MetJ family transcriptional regulator
MTAGRASSKAARSGKVTVSLPVDLIEFADQFAEQAGTSRSQAMAEALRVLKRAERDRLMAEGFRYYHDDAVQMAEEGMAATNEVWPRD